MVLCRLHKSNAMIARGIVHLFWVVLDVVALEPGELIEAEF